MSEVTRRKFLKRTGGATVASFVAWTATSQKSHATGEGSASWDINFRSGKLAGVNLANVSGHSADYYQSHIFDVLIHTSLIYKDRPDCCGGREWVWDEEFRDRPIPYLRCKLKAWYNPISMSPHPEEATFTVVAEMFGGFPFGDVPVVVQSDKWEFYGLCNRSNGLIAPVRTLVASAPASHNGGVEAKDPTYSSTDPEHDDYRVSYFVTLTDLLIEPHLPDEPWNTLAAREVKFSGNFKVIETRYYQSNNLGSIDRIEKRFEFILKSHLHE